MTGRERAALTALARTVAGRTALTMAALLLFVGAAAASARVAAASGREGPAAEYTPPPPANYPRLDREAPPLALVNQHGDTVTLGRLRGRPVLLTFAYAHCMSVCPVVVREVLDAQRRLAARRVQVVVITLDPWRDTPARLATVAEEWQLREDAWVVSGDTATVLRTLDAWNVPHARDGSSGEITHPALVYLIDGGGRLAYAATPQAKVLVALAGRIE